MIERTIIFTVMNAIGFNFVIPLFAIFLALLGVT